MRNSKNINESQSFSADWPADFAYKLCPNFVRAQNARFKMRLSTDAPLSMLELYLFFPREILLQAWIRSDANCSITS